MAFHSSSPSPHARDVRYPAWMSAANFCLALVVMTPSLLLTLLLLTPDPPAQLSGHGAATAAAAAGADRLRRWAVSLSPQALVCSMFTANVSLGFWLIGLLQRSTWLIDPYWTILPVLISEFFAAHPAVGGGGGNNAASATVTVTGGASPAAAAAAAASSLLSSSRARGTCMRVLVAVWSIRLTHSYLRRERWRWGWREDWRFAKIRHEHGRVWWLTSLPIVYLSQQVFLIGITAPFAATHSPHGLPWGLWDAVASCFCLAGLAIAYTADSQLHAFVSTRDAAVVAAVGSPPSVSAAAAAASGTGLENPHPAVLSSGLWRWSRHPNYVGEQMWWWGVAWLGANTVSSCPSSSSSYPSAQSLHLPLCRPTWRMFVGTLINSLCLVCVTAMVEERMVTMGPAARRSAYRKYQKTTPVWLPLWPCAWETALAARARMVSGLLFGMGQRNEGELQGPLDARVKDD